MLVHRTHAHVSPFRQLSAELDRMFESLFAPSSTRRATAFGAVDLRETDEAYVLEAELPGVRADDVELLVDSRKVTLRARREDGTEPTDGDSQVRSRRERAVGSFERKFELPAGIDADAIQASLALGVLTATLPKLAAEKPRRIAVQGG